MASEPEKTSEPEREIADIEDSNDERNEEKIKIETTSTSTNPKLEDKKLPKACDEDPYILKIFKSLMNPQGSQGSAEDKKK